MGRVGGGWNWWTRRGFASCSSRESLRAAEAEVREMSRGLWLQVKRVRRWSPGDPRGSWRVNQGQGREVGARGLREQDSKMANQRFWKG